MKYRILIIDPDEKKYLHLNSLLEKMEEQTCVLDWVPHWHDIHDPLFFRQYDSILAVNTARQIPTTADLPNEQAFEELKSRFISMANHEFRTPLTSIASSADLVEAYVNRGDYEKVSKHIARIKNSVNELNLILAEMLSLDKLDQGKTQVHTRPINLPELVANVRDEFQEMLKPGQEIWYEHHGPELIVLDPILFKTVLAHLLSNASKYSSPHTSIELSTQVSDEKTILRVADHGIGIPAEDRERLFDRFYRARNAVNIQGTGLGLYLSKNYVDLMGGTIGYSSELGKGSIFWVELSR